MSILVVGSVALDSVETPFAKGNDVLGGSATYFSTSASFFTRVQMVAVVGEDFPQAHIEFLKSRHIDTTGLVREKGKTFRWKGKYAYDLNEAQTLDTQLNVFEQFKPVIPAEYASTPYLFLANIDPELQMQVLNQVTNPKIVALDTMNYWISTKLDALKQVIQKADILIINEGEARQLTQESNLVKAAKKIIAMGAKTLIIKRGEYGVIMFTENTTFAAPAFPLGDVIDPTGAGDTFAGGFMGYLASTGELTDANIRQAIIFGSVMASFNVEALSLDRLKTLHYPDVLSRFQLFKKLTSFSDLLPSE